MVFGSGSGMRVILPPADVDEDGLATYFVRVRSDGPVLVDTPLVNVQCLSAPTPTGTAPGSGVVNSNSSQTCAQYRYSSFSKPDIVVQNQSRQSLYQIRVGVRFEF